MLRTISFVAFILLLLGCAGGGGRAKSVGSYGGGSGELTIMDYRATYLPRASHFAKFEIIDGVGVSLLYPTRDGDRRQLEVGSHYVDGLVPTFVKAQRELYDPRATGLLNQAPRAIRRAMILVVVSGEPLNLDPFLSSPSGLRDFLGRRFAEGNMAMSEILNAVVPQPEPGYWEYDTRIVEIPRNWAIGG